MRSFILTLLIFSKISKNVVGNQANISVCETAFCKRTSSKMLKFIDETADACENFHRFACGNFEHDPTWTEELFDKMEKYLSRRLSHLEGGEHYLRIFHIFHESCVNYEADFGSVEKIKFWREFQQANLTKIFIELLLTQSHPFIDIGVGIGNDSLYQLQIIPPGKSAVLKSTINSFKSSDKKCLENIKYYNSFNLETMYQNYKNCITNATIIKGLNTIDSNQVLNQHLFKETMQNFALLYDEIKDKNYAQISVNELNKRYDFIDWKILFNRITGKHNFNGAEKIIIPYYSYVNKALITMMNYSEEYLKNILYTYSLSKLNDYVLIPSTVGKRKHFCMNLASELMPDISAGITNNLTDDNIRYFNALTNQLFEQIKAELNSAFEQSQIEETYKKELQEKLKNIQLATVGSGNTNSAKTVYRDINLNLELYFENVLELLKVYRRNIYSLHGVAVSPASLLNYFLSSLSKEPKSFYGSNYIVFHPAIYQNLDMTGSEHSTLARLELYLGRELAKQFDDTGRQFGINNDKLEGNKDPYNILLERINSLFTFYFSEGYTVDGREISLTGKGGKWNGTELLNELTSDNTAFRLVHNIFGQLNKTNAMPWISDYYNSKQVFFILLAQEYCGKSGLENFMINMAENRQLPSEVKVQNLVGNSEDFGDTFNCPEGAAMLIDSSLMTVFPYSAGLAKDDEYDDQYEYDDTD